MLSARKQAAIEALLTTASRAKAAEKCKVSVATLCRWEEEEEFKQGLIDAADAAFGATARRLKAGASKATEVLLEGLETKEITKTLAKVAEVVLNLAARYTDQYDILLRLKKLEMRDSEGGKGDV